MARCRAVGHDAITVEAGKLRTVPAPEAAARRLFRVVHRAEIQPAVVADMTVVDAVAGLSGLDRREGLGLTTPEMQPGEAGLEARDDDVGVAREGDEPDPLLH